LHPAVGPVGHQQAPVLAWPRIDGQTVGIDEFPRPFGAVDRKLITTVAIIGMHQHGAVAICHPQPDGRSPDIFLGNPGGGESEFLVSGVCGLFQTLLHATLEIHQFDQPKRFIRQPKQLLTAAIDQRQAVRSGISAEARQQTAVGRVNQHSRHRLVEKHDASVAQNIDTVRTQVAHPALRHRQVQPLLMPNPATPR